MHKYEVDQYVRNEYFGVLCMTEHWREYGGIVLGLVLAVGLLAVGEH